MLLGDQTRTLFEAYPGSLETHMRNSLGVSDMNKVMDCGIGFLRYQYIL